MSAPRGLVLIEAALPEPYALVTARDASRQRERGHFFANADEARTFARDLAEQRGLMLVDLIAAAEGGAE